MILTGPEKRLCLILRDLPQEYGYRYSKTARQALQRALFASLVAENEGSLVILFKGNVPRNGEDWSLRAAQGYEEGSEYSEAARGRACGHIFKSGDANYRCKTCTADDTCVLCTRCFEASDHEGHIITQQISQGNSGCCDCGDEEAWKLPINCAIHTANESTAAGKQRQGSNLPDELVESIKMTIGRTMDYICDVISCSPENLRLEKNADAIKEDERASYLDSKWYEESENLNPGFALMLWNDEKHTVDEVQAQVARACKQRQSFGLEKANETNDVGRSVVKYSNDVDELLRVTKVIEQIKITVTIRSSRDTFREEMCDTMIEWLEDVAGCSVGNEHDILQHTICKELLKTWRTGSSANNKRVGKQGIDDHEIDESSELSKSVRVSARSRGVLTSGRHRLVMMQDETDSDDEFVNANDNDDGDDEAESQVNEDGVESEPMELDVVAAGLVAANHNTERDMRTPGELEDETEVSEATYAGYPPPPPPPPPPQRMQVHGPIRTFSGDSDLGEPLATASFTPKPIYEIPETPWPPRKIKLGGPPAYWLEKPESSAAKEPLPLHEDLHQRIRLDWFMLFDLRLWKKARIGLRDLYIRTVVSVPQFKRVLGLRFAGVYTLLAQLYLIADREPDLSVINLAVQMLTTTSIVNENVERANFLTNVLAILYTFLTERQVGHPWDVSMQATLAFDAGSVANRRMYFFFADLKRLFDNTLVREKLRTQERYQLQFLDLVRLPQGICPNIRAIGDHVEYENDVWIGASLMTKDINRLCRQFAESFHYRDEDSKLDLKRVIRTVAKATTINSTGAERFRFDQAEVKGETRFITTEPFHFENGSDEPRPHSVVSFVVEKEPISFHHALHYTLSWLIDVGKSMSASEMRSLLCFTIEELKEPPPRKALIPSLDPESYLMALFDFPMRVCAWLAQMKAGMWVRNGLSLRHQMGTYRGVSHRDFGHHRDIFLLQTAMVICNPSRVLASIVNRFSMDDWMRGHFVTRAGFELSQQLDIAEDFIHLLIVILCDRTALQPANDDKEIQEAALRRDIIHLLCFKPLSFSDLNNRIGLSEKGADLEESHKLLEEMTNYRAPEGLSDTGSFELKREYLVEVDPYTAHYTKNQRDEAEHAYRSWMAKRSGKSESDIVLEPKLRPIESGMFQDLSIFTKTPLFTQIVFYSLAHHMHPHLSSETPATRLEAFLLVVLHLILAAVLEDHTEDDEEDAEGSPSFILNVLQKPSELGSTIFDVLIRILDNSEIKGCHPKVRLILHRIRQRQPRTYSSVVSSLLAQGTRAPALALDKLGFESPRTPLDSDQEAKDRQAKQLRKQQALDRQARVMAQFQQQQQNFMNNQDIAELAEDSDELGSIVTGTTEEHKKTWKYPSGNCILCQEETNDTRLFGTFGLMTNSNMFRQTDISDPDFLGEVIATPASLDRAADELRPFGVAGQNRKKVSKRAHDGSEVSAEHQGLGKGFSSLHTSIGPSSVGCGHIMHYSCFDLYCAATQRRQNHQIARNHPERLELKEFVCPLCKALGNTFLPIIWRGKEELYPGALQTDAPFDDWLSSLTVSRFYKREEGRSNPHRDQFVSYTSKAVIPPLASKLTVLFQSPLTSPSSPHGPGNRLTLPSRIPPEGSFNTTMIAPSHPLSTDILLIDELITIYTRIRETIKANSLPSRFPNMSEVQGRAVEDLGHTDTLAKTLGNSIVATEIAQRGVQSQPGQTLLDRIPTSVTTHLRVLSETASSYIAIGGMRNGGTSTPAYEFSEITRHQLLQLFAGHPQINGDDAENMIRIRLPSALSHDSFVFLTECSVSIVPGFNLDIHHIVRLCYMLEMVKVVLYLTAYPETFDAWRSTSRQQMGGKVLPEDVYALQRFSMRIRLFTNPPWPMAVSAEGNGRFPSADFWVPLYKAVSTYALTFLRKAAILLNIRYGVDFPDTGFGETGESELDRLTKVLNLPSLSTMLDSVRDPDNNELTVQESMMAGWIQHWQWHEGHNAQVRPPRIEPDNLHQEILKTMAYKSLRPGHPAIFELIGLPKQFDTLIYEVTRRRCPTTGNRLEDAALCLFCGDIFCSQASCCHKGGKGGCNQHMQKLVFLPPLNMQNDITEHLMTILQMRHRHGSFPQYS